MSLFDNLDFETKRKFDFEEHLVKTLLKHYGIGGMKHDLLRRCEELTGNKRLTLGLFLAQFPSFPSFLHPSQPAQLDKDCTIRRLMGGVSKTRLWAAWEKAQEFRPASRKPMALLVRWPRSSYTMAFHNGPMPDQSGPRFTFTKDKKVYAMEPMIKYLKGLGWSPEDDLNA